MHTTPLEIFNKQLPSTLKTGSALHVLLSKKHTRSRIELQSSKMHADGH